MKRWQPIAPTQRLRIVKCWYRLAHTSTHHLSVVINEAGTHAAVNPNEGGGIRTETHRPISVTHIFEWDLS